VARISPLRRRNAVSAESATRPRHAPMEISAITHTPIFPWSVRHSECSRSTSRTRHWAGLSQWHRRPCAAIQCATPPASPSAAPPAATGAARLWQSRRMAEADGPPITTTPGQRRVGNQVAVHAGRKPAERSCPHRSAADSPLYAAVRSSVRSLRNSGLSGPCFRSCAPICDCQQVYPKKLQ
jgi:hypothetical protein